MDRSDDEGAISPEGACVCVRVCVCARGCVGAIQPLGPMVFLFLHVVVHKASWHCLSDGGLRYMGQNCACRL